MAARFIIGDTRDALARLSDASVDLVLSSPPFLALRSYLPADHPDKAREIGAEATPGEYLDVLLDVVEECRRVLAPHGSLVFELGDTYAGRDHMAGWPMDKSLCLIPEMFAFALAYGFNPLTGRVTPSWRVRNKIAWCRPNPPVGSLGDKFRPGTSYMTVACMDRKRYFDLDAVREPGSPNSHGGGVGVGDPKRASPEMFRLNGGVATATAPPLDWWVIPSQPYKGSHYATWPEKLLVRPILAMCPEKVCNTCGDPSRRTVSGWTDCGHDDWRRGIVLDPFGGSGTTAAVAEARGRDSILIDLDDRNAELAATRVGMWLTVEQTAPMR